MSLGGLVGQWGWDGKNVESNFIIILVYIKKISIIKHIIFYININCFWWING